MPAHAGDVVPAMKVLQFHTTYRDRGGEDVAVATEASLLRAAGHEVIQRVAANPETTGMSLRVVATAMWNQRARRAAQRALHEATPDVVSVHNTWFALSPSIVAAAAAADRPVLMTLHNYRLMCPAGTLFHHGAACFDCVGTHPWHAVGHRCYRDSAALSAIGAATVEVWHRTGVLDTVSRFVVMTPSGKELFVRGGLPAERIVVRPHGVADPGEGDQPPSASHRLVYAGRAVPEKGLDMLLRAWTRRPRAFHLDVVGDGPVAAAWRDRDPAGVTFHGPRPRGEVLARMRAARAVVVPSLWPEPFGLVAVEAMACGRPVLSTGVGGLADIHGPDGGFVAPPQDPDAWDDLLDGLDDEIVDHAGAMARARYEARYTEEHARRSLLAMYANVV